MKSVEYPQCPRWTQAQQYTWRLLLSLQPVYCRTSIYRQKHLRNIYTDKQKRWCYGSATGHPTYSFTKLFYTYLETTIWNSPRNGNQWNLKKLLINFLEIVFKYIHDFYINEHIFTRRILCTTYVLYYIQHN